MTRGNCRGLQHNVCDIWMIEISLQLLLSPCFEFRIVMSGSKFLRRWSRPEVPYNYDEFSFLFANF